MNHNTPIYTMKNYRDEAFLRQCRRILDQADGPLTMAEVALKAACSEAPRFFLDPEYAWRRLKYWRNKGLDTIRAGSASEVFIELDRRVNRLAVRFNLPQRLCLERVLEQERAPSYYLTPTAARSLYYRILKERRLSGAGLPHRRHRSPHSPQ